MIDPKTLELAADLVTVARRSGVRITTAESCTGGLVSGALTSVSGSSDMFQRGFVTYSNEAKQELLGVGEDDLKRHGAVSEPVARAMAEGALAAADADLAVAITGVAGPGQSERKPAGTVWIAVAGKLSPTRAILHRFSGDRAGVRAAAVERALAMLLDEL